jgi:serine phosphatase RsbU (regulator of sigma subunit)
VAIAELGKALRADRCCFVSVDVEARKVSITHEWFRENILPLDVSGVLGGSASGLIDPFMHLETTFTIEDVTTNKWTRDVADDYMATSARSQLLVPLLEGTALVGVLFVAMTDQPRVWSNADVLLAEAVAAQTRASVHLARFLQREHNIAERLQEALKPGLSEDIPGLDLDYFYRPALSEASIGGDFFDVFVVKNGCVALVVGDLSGKGLAAASQIATVRNMLRFAVYKDSTLSGAIRALNDILVEHHLLQGFATLFVGLYDSDERSLTYVSCGHETALLRRRAGGSLEELEPTGPIVGAFAGAEFHQATSALEPGDALLVFTDGLSEAGRGRHEFLGVEGLAEFVRGAPTGCCATDYIERIIHGVEIHNRGTIHDDECLVAAVIREQ